VTRKDLERYRNTRLPDLPRDEGPSAVIKSLWVDRAPRWIGRQRNGIDTWPADGAKVKIGELANAYVEITSILSEDGADVGLAVAFHMKSKDAPQHEHMATFYYGPPRTRMGFQLKRELVRTQYHV
jgi:hypothetical protein